MRFTEDEWAAFQRNRGLKIDTPPPLIPNYISHYMREVFRLEKDFQAWVLSIAYKWGWRHYHTRRSDKSPKGWPDLVLAHEEWNILLYRELKLDGKDPTEDQQWWLDMLINTGHDAGVWRPRDGQEIVHTLSGGREHLPKVA